METLNPAGDDDRLLLKEVVKKGHVQLKQRLVPQDAVQRWQNSIEAAEPDVEQVIREEREEAYLRKAEMEAKKAEVGIWNTIQVRQLRICVLCDQPQQWVAFGCVVCGYNSL